MRSNMVWEYDFSYSTPCYVVNCRFLSRVTARYSPRLRMSGLLLPAFSYCFQPEPLSFRLVQCEKVLFLFLSLPRFALSAEGSTHAFATRGPTPCRGHGLAACYAGARRVQRRVWGLRRATCRRTFMTRLMLRHEKKVAKRRLKIKQNIYIWLYC